MRFSALLASAAVLLAAPAAAQVYPPIANRQYAIDLYRGAAVGSPRVIGMGGSATAVAVGAEGLIGNPAAVAMRSAGAQGRWDWDGTLDAFVPSLGSDIDNNGNVTPATVEARMGSAALLGLSGDWGLGASYSSITYTVSPSGQAARALPVEFRAALGRLALGRAVLDRLVVAALGLRVGGFTMARPRGETLFSVSGTSLEVGILAARPEWSTRWGARLSLPVQGSSVQSSCNPLDCDGLVLPERASAPWEAAGGIAHRLSATPWNRASARRFVDDRALTLAVDLVLSGGVADATGVEPFSAGVLQPSGRGVAVSLRTGAEYECLPGWLRLRAGSYWEPARFAGVTGRLHGTLGLEVRLLGFEMWGGERRLALSFAGDGSRNYGSAGISLGFWH